MSYTIIYEKLFIKVSESKVIPMIIVGDNNVWQNSGINERRARDPYCPTINGKVAVTLEEIKADLKREYNTIFNPKNEETANRKEKDYGYYAGIALYGKGTYRTTWKMYENVYLKGYEQALTVEQVKNSISISIEVNRRGTYINPELDLLTKHGFETSEELNEYINMVDKRIKEEGKGAYTYKCKVNGWAVEEACKRLRKKYFPIEKRVKVPTEVDSYYAITIDANGNYLTQSKKGSINYSRWSDSAKAFLTEKQAEAQVKRLNKRSWHNSVKFNVIKVNEKRTILV
jgi:hypothetical protein